MRGHPVQARHLHPPGMTLLGSMICKLMSNGWLISHSPRSQPTERLFRNAESMGIHHL